MICLFSLLLMDCLGGFLCFWLPWVKLPRGFPGNLAVRLCASAAGGTDWSFVRQLRSHKPCGVVKKKKKVKKKKNETKPWTSKIVFPGKQILNWSFYIKVSTGVVEINTHGKWQAGLGGRRDGTQLKLDWPFRVAFCVSFFLLQKSPQNLVA